MRRLAALAFGLVLLAVSSRAQQEIPAQMKSDLARLRAMKQKPDDFASAGAGLEFRGEKEAAVALVDLVRKLPDQRMEYCAYILRDEAGRFRFSPIRQGDMNHCPADRPKPANAVASVHTHPLGGRDADTTAAGQVFSEGDFNFAESAEMNFPIYLGAPAGHVLRYAPGGTSCKGQSFIRRNFGIVRDLRPTVDGRLPVNPGADMPLFSMAGEKLPKPPYCRPL